MVGDSVLVSDSEWLDESERVAENDSVVVKLPEIVCEAVADGVSENDSDVVPDWDSDPVGDDVNDVDSVNCSVIVGSRDFVSDAAVKLDDAEPETEDEADSLRLDDAVSEREVDFMTDSEID